LKKQISINKISKTINQIMNSKMLRKALMIVILFPGMLNTVNKAKAQNVISQDNSKKQAVALIREIQVGLQLTDKQKDSLYSIFYNRSNLLDSVRLHFQNNPLKKQEITSKITILNSKIDSLLTTEQKVIYSKWKADKNSKKKS